MRMLQIFGIFVSILISLYGIWQIKRGVFSHSNFLISQFIAILLLFISLFPSLGDIIATPLHMERWNGVIFVAILLLITLFFYNLNLTNSNKRTISELVQSLAYLRFKEEYKDFQASEILVVIPAYHEEDNIEEVLEQIPSEINGLYVKSIVVVDGSTDRTENIVRKTGVPVMVNPIRRGGGVALRAGYITAMEFDVKVVVTLDADGQHLPAEIPLLVEPILYDEADIINGSRVLGTFERENLLRSVGVVIFNWLVSILMGKHITDSSNAFRAIRVETLKKLSLEQDQFHASELLIDSIKKGARVKEVGVTIRKRQQGTTKKPRSLKYGWGFLKAIINTYFR